MTDNSNVTTRNAQAPNSSTLIEFPGVNRNRPAWRKELSERFREIQQQKRAREADPEGGVGVSRRAAGESVPTHEEARAAAKAKASEAASKQLGLVPAPDEPELNPLVAAALRRIERARVSASTQPALRQGSGRGQAATAAARVVEEQPVQEPEPLAPTPPPLVVVQPKQQPAKAVRPQDSTAKAEPAAARVEVEEPHAQAATAQTVTTQTNAAKAAVTESPAAVAEPLKLPEAANPASQPSASAAADAASRQPRHLTGVLDEFWLERQGIELLPKVEEKELTYDDRAPRSKRMAAAFIDLLAVAFLSAPFAAGIELTISNWNDPRVSGSMALIAALVMFLYHTCSVALAGRTLGMSLVGLHAVDARKACVPSTGQCMRRAVVYMLSLATFGLGLLYSLFDAEGRTVHDLLSGTVVVRK
jgi:uncharacterized RDD family membrane protein YckC